MTKAFRAAVQPRDGKPCMYTLFKVFSSARPDTIKNIQCGKPARFLVEFDDGSPSMQVCKNYLGMCLHGRLIAQDAIQEHPEGDDNER